MKDQLLAVLLMQRGSFSHLSAQYCMYIFSSQMKRDRNASFPHFSIALASACAPSAASADCETFARDASCAPSSSGGAFDRLDASFAGV
jgi:hypothetical protein